MDADERRSRLDKLSQQVTGCSYEVENGLGVGFLEKVYENALTKALRKQGIAVEQQKPMQVWYDGEVVGEYIADLIVGGLLIVELKVVKSFHDIHMAQCLNYLKATGLTLCFLIDFGSPRVEVRRVVNQF